MDTDGLKRVKRLNGFIRYNNFVRFEVKMILLMKQKTIAITHIMLYSIKCVKY